MKPATFWRSNSARRAASFFALDSLAGISPLIWRASMRQRIANRPRPRVGTQFILDNVLVLFYSGLLSAGGLVIELAQSTGRRSRSIIIDTDDNIVTPNRIFVHQSRKGFICVGIGAGAELMARAERLAGVPAEKRGRMAGRVSDPYLECLDRLAKGYNPDEARVPASNPGGGQ